jgi:hypothetical protein
VRHVIKTIKVRKQPETLLHEIQSTQPPKLVRLTFNLIYETITHIKLDNRKNYNQLSLSITTNNEVQLRA